MYLCAWNLLCLSPPTFLPVIPAEKTLVSQPSLFQLNIMGMEHIGSDCGRDNDDITSQKNFSAALHDIKT